MSGGPLFVKNLAKRIVEFMNEDELTVCKRRLAAWEASEETEYRKLKCHFCNHFFPTPNPHPGYYPHECYDPESDEDCIAWCGLCDANPLLRKCGTCKYSVCIHHAKPCKTCKEPMCLFCQYNYGGKRHQDCEK